MMKQAIKLLIVIIFSSCQYTQQEIVKQNVEEYVKLRMDDPDSYEFVELTFKDSVLISDNIKYRRNDFKRYIEYKKDQILILERYKADSSSLYSEEEANKIKKEGIKEINNTIKRSKLILTKIDSLEALLGTSVNNVASYTYSFSYRGNNKLGEKVLNKNILQTNPAPDFKILNLGTSKEEVLLNTSDFPGYREMMKNVKD